MIRKQRGFLLNPYRFSGGGGAPTDPNFSSVRLLLHFEGADNSTTFTDSSSDARTPTVNGDARIRTDQFRFGAASGRFDGTGDFLSYADSAGLELGASNWTIEAFMRYSALPSVNALIASKFVGTGNQRSYVFFQFNNSGTQQLAFQWSTDGATTNLVTVNYTPPTNTWIHVALTRSGSNLRFFVDGTQVGTTQSVTGTFFNSTAALEIGGNFNGWMDEFRLTNGVARYTANFTAPTAQFPDA